MTRTGELFIGTAEKLSQGVLIFDSKSGDSDYKIEWKEVVFINTYHHLRLTLDNNEILVASLRDNYRDDNKLKIVGENIDREIAYDQILAFEKISNDFWGKMDMNVNLGYSYAKGTKTHQLSVRSAASYLSNNWGFNGNYNEFYTLIDTAQSSRMESSLKTQYIMKRSWYTEASSNWFSSDEQEIALRTTVMVGVGRYVLNDPVKYLSFGAGIALNLERFIVEENPRNQSYELFLHSDYVLFDHKFLGIKSSFTGFVNLNEADRYRSTFNLDFSWDIGDDFDLVWGYSLNYDSKPPNSGQQADYVVSLTFGWEL